MNINLKSAGVNFDPPQAFTLPKKSPGSWGIINPIIYGGGKFTPTKVILFALFQAAYGVEKSSKVCEPITFKKILSNF